MVQRRRSASWAVRGTERARRARTVDSAAGVEARVTVEAAGDALFCRAGAPMLAIDSRFDGSGVASGATVAWILAIIWLSRPSRAVEPSAGDEGEPKLLWVGVGEVGDGAGSAASGRGARGASACADIMASYRSYASSMRGLASASAAGDGGSDDEPEALDSGRAGGRPPSRYIDWGRRARTAGGGPRARRGGRGGRVESTVILRPAASSTRKRSASRCSCASWSSSSATALTSSSEDEAPLSSSATLMSTASPAVLYEDGRCESLGTGGGARRPSRSDDADEPERARVVGEGTAEGEGDGMATEAASSGGEVITSDMERGAAGRSTFASGEGSAAGDASAAGEGEERSGPPLVVAAVGASASRMKSDGGWGRRGRRKRDGFSLCCTEGEAA